MPYIAYIHKNYHKATLELIEQCQEIIEEYARAGFDLTVRQLYYQLVSRAYIPNNEKSYRRTVSTVSDARMTGHINWLSIVDRTRNVRSNPHWKTPAEIMSSAAQGFQLDKWNDQDERVEVWIEKDALIGVIGDVCRRQDVSYFSCRGYVSQSEIWRAAQRIRDRWEYQNQKTVVLHLADLDPSGVDMTRDITDRLTTFTQYWEGSEFTVDRIALLESQVLQYNPPPNPAKLSDSRSSDYIRIFGYSSWELDALDPTVLAQLIQTNVQAHRDQDLWEEYLQRENEDKAHLGLISDHFGAIAQYATDTFGI